jgi:hypothetical protein
VLVLVGVLHAVPTGSCSNEDKHQALVPTERVTHIAPFGRQHSLGAGAVWVSGGDAPFLAPSGSLSIADGEGWGKKATG